MVGQGQRSIKKSNPLGNTKLYLTLCLAIGIGALDSARAQYDDEEVDQLEIEVEDAMGESEAARQQAISAEKRKKQYESELENAKQDAQNAIAKAKAKKRDYELEIENSQKEIERLKSEIQKYKRQEELAQADFRRYEEKIAESRAKVDSVRMEMEKVKSNLRAKQDLVVQQTEKARQLDAQLRQEQDGLAKSQRDLENSRLKETKVRERIVGSTKKLEQARANYKDRIAQHQQKINAYLQTIAKNEEGLRNLRKDVTRLEEQAVIAEAEVEQARQRAQASRQRLEEVKQQTNRKRQELQQRKGRAIASSRSLGASEAVGRIEAAKAGQDYDALSAKSGAQDVQIALRSKGGQRLPASQDCPIRQSAKRSAKRVGIVRKGMALSVKEFNRYWYEVNGGDSGFVARACFR